MIEEPPRCIRARVVIRRSLACDPPTAVVSVGEQGKKTRKLSQQEFSRILLMSKNPTLREFFELDAQSFREGLDGRQPRRTRGAGENQIQSRR